jgi:predicted transcriptional regulator
MPETSPSGRTPRHSILDLAPLELDCMTVIWSLGAGTVRDIQDRLMPTRPRAYTTVMTIMDRLAQKGIVSRQKVGRAYRYEAKLSSDDARNNAIQKVVAGFFNGSTEALVSHLANSKPKPAPEATVVESQPTSEADPIAPVQPASAATAESPAVKSASAGSDES